jgi:hypothetical protein
MHVIGHHNPSKEPIADPVAKQEIGLNNLGDLRNAKNARAVTRIHEGFNAVAALNFTARQRDLLKARGEISNDMRGEAIGESKGNVLNRGGTLEVREVIAGMPPTFGVRMERLIDVRA